MWRLWTRGWGVRAWWFWLTTEGFAWFVARHLPRNIAYWAFIRVHGASEVHWDFKSVAENWHRGAGK